MNAERRRVWPPRLVDVFDGGSWQRGQLEAWLLSDRGHRAYVRYGTTTGREVTHPRWVDGSRIRPRDLTRTLGAEAEAEAEAESA